MPRAHRRLGNSGNPRIEHTGEQQWNGDEADTHHDEDNVGRALATPAKGFGGGIIVRDKRL